MKIGCCQYNPIFCEREKNMRKARKLLLPFKSGDFDLIVFPEMAFTGYMFDDKKEVEPMLEDEKGPTFQFCCEIAKQYSCYVAAGYPRKDEGVLLLTYDKSFLYETDHKWADEGKGFVSIFLPAWNKTVGFGICMDINPYEYIDRSLYEFGNFHLTHKSDMIIFCANWLDSTAESDTEYSSGSDDDEEDISDKNSAISVQSYWVSRLKPLIGKECKLIVANRVGTEKGTTFCGGSCILSLKEPGIIASLPKRKERMLVAEI